MSSADEPDLRSVLVHSSMRADESGARASSLLAGAVAPAWHYRSFHQAELWWQVHQAHAPQGHQGVLEIYAEAAAAVANRAAAAVEVVGVASGGGEKEALVVAAVANGTREVHYLPVDIAVELALRSSDAGERLGVVCTPVVGDIAAMPDFPAWLASRREDASAGPGDGAGGPGDGAGGPGDGAGGPGGWVAHGGVAGTAVDTVVTAFGITPNIEPSVLLPWLRDVLGPSGELLISANLFTSWQEILPQYDNPETARWLEQLLVDWGLASMLSPVQFEVGEVAGVPAVIAFARWRAYRSWHFDGHDVEVREGEALRLFFSLRFTPDLFVSTCARHGLDVIEGYIDEHAGEGVWRVRASLPAERASSHDGAGDGPTQKQ